MFDRVVFKAKMDRSYCPFCDRKIIEFQKFYEDDVVMGLYSHKPITEGHCLIIPKRHIERFDDLTEQESLSINDLIKKTNKAAMQVLNINDYLILQKNGESVGQTVPHVHFHYIPRKAEDKGTLRFLFKFVTSSLKKPISEKEMSEVTQSLQSVI
jgi:diadenosine tetraphosphate (Ap4A) HIT family hydrolase